MKRTPAGWLLVLWVMAATLAATPVLFAQRPLPLRYSLTDLGTLGGTSSEASALNRFGDVVGASATETGEMHAFLYRNGQLYDLGTLTGGTASHATAINDEGVIVGFSGINAYGPQFSEFTQGFVWRDGGMGSIGALYCPCTFNVRYGTSRSFAVSNSGIVVGDSRTNRQVLTHAFEFQGTAMRDIGADVNGGADSAAYGINDAGHTVGTVNGRAFVLADNVVRDLGVLPGHATSSARAINLIGQVVGESISAGGIPTAFLWDLGTMRALDALPGDAASEARAINSSGEIAGRSGSADFSRSRAVVWRNGAAIDLNTRVEAPGWTLTGATGINDVGQIAGVGVRNGQQRAFLLSPS